MSAKKLNTKSEGEPVKLPFSARNYSLLAIALVLILLGFVVLSTGDITISPILLVLGYCVFLPAGILLKPKFSATPTEGSVKEEV